VRTVGNLWSVFLRASATTSSDGGTPGLIVRIQEPKEFHTSLERLRRCFELGLVRRPLRVHTNQAEILATLLARKKRANQSWRFLNSWP